MILTLFSVLISIAFFVVWLGFNYDDNGYRIVGFFFVFLLSLVLINNQLSYKSGNTFSVNGSMVVGTTDVYTSYTDTSSHWIGYFLAIASSIGMITAWMYPKSGSIKE